MVLTGGYFTQQNITNHTAEVDTRRSAIAVGGHSGEIDIAHRVTIGPVFEHNSGTGIGVGNNIGKCNLAQDLIGELDSLTAVVIGGNFQKCHGASDWLLEVDAQLAIAIEVDVAEIHVSSDRSSDLDAGESIVEDVGAAQVNVAVNCPQNTHTR